MPKEDFGDILGDYLGKIIMTVVSVMIYIVLLMDFYNIIVNQSAIITGNPVADSLIAIFGLVFASAILIVMYSGYVLPNEG